MARTTRPSSFASRNRTAATCRPIAGFRCARALACAARMASSNAGVPTSASPVDRAFLCGEPMKVQLVEYTFNGRLYSLEIPAENEDEALARVERGGLQPPVVPGEAFRAGLFDEKLGVLCAVGGLLQHPPGRIPIHRAAAVPASSIAVSHDMCGQRSAGTTAIHHVLPTMVAMSEADDALRARRPMSRC